MPEVDVIIPAYNAARYLPAAIGSVAAQTFADWQIILVDDGSTDNTSEVVSLFRESLGEKLKYVKQENRGMTAARNVAIQSSSSEFIAFLDADDIWMPCRLMESLEAFGRKPEVGISYGLVSRVGPDGAHIDTPPGNLHHIEGWIAPYLYMRTVHLPCCTVTCRRTCLNKVGLFDERMRATEDRDLWFRVAQNYRVAFIPKVLANYRVSLNSVSSDPEKMFRAQLQFICKHYGQPGCGPRARRLALSTAYKERAEVLCNRHNLLEALKSSLHAFALYPFNLNNARSTTSLLLKWMRLKSST